MSKTKFWSIVYVFLFLQMITGYVVSQYYLDVGAQIMISGGITTVLITPIVICMYLWSKLNA